MNAIGKAVAALAITFASVADAQVRIEIAPTFGGYFPTRALPASTEFWGCSSDCMPLPPHDLRQVRTGAAGGRVAVWLNHRSAVEASFWYAPSKVTDDPAYGDPGAGTITTAGLRYVFRVDPGSHILSLLLMAGPAFVHRSGDAWAGIAGTTSPALGLGLGIDAFSASRIGLRGEVSDYLYNLELSGDSKAGAWSYSDASAFQQDLMISLALSFRP